MRENEHRARERVWDRSFFESEYGYVGRKYRGSARATWDSGLDRAPTSLHLFPPSLLRLVVLTLTCSSRLTAWSERGKSASDAMAICTVVADMLAKHVESFAQAL